MTSFREQPDDLDESLPLSPMRLRVLDEDQLPALKSLLTSLVNSHPTKLTKDQRHKLRDTFRLVLLNVICNSYIGKYTALPRGASAYKAGSYWSNCGLTFRLTIAALERLKQTEYIREEAGFFNRGSGTGKLTRIYGLPRLAEVLNVEQIASVSEVEWDDTSLVDIQGLPYKAEVLPDDHPDIVRLKAINSFLREHDWPYKEPIRLIYIDSPVMGGRVYTRFQSMPKEMRGQLKLDGQDTIELDYKANHLSMLIAQSGQKLPSDPYTVIANDTGATRNQVKQFMTSSLGSDSEPKAFNALKLHRFNKALFNKIKDSCHKHFPGDYLFKGIGTALQSLEGQIALDVMYEGSKVGIPVLPVHDSFMTTPEHEDWLRRQMEEQWSKHTNDHGTRPRIDKKSPQDYIRNNNNKKRIKTKKK